MATKTVNIDVQVQTKSLQDLEQELEEINAQLNMIDSIITLLKK